MKCTGKVKIVWSCASIECFDTKGCTSVLKKDSDVNDVDNDYKAGNKYDHKRRWCGRKTCYIEHGGGCICRNGAAYDDGDGGVVAGGREKSESFVQWKHRYCRKPCAYETIVLKSPLFERESLFSYHIQ